MFCSQCGARNTEGVRFCEECGMPLDPKERHLVASEMGQPAGGPGGVAGYGGFWRRVAAVLLDGLILIMPLSLLQMLVAPGTMEPAMQGPNAMVPQWTWWDGVVMIAAWLYWAGMHSSPYQATVGKMALGMKVTDLDGERISFARATGRHLAEFLSAMLLMIGYLMVAFTRRKQGLHDIIAGTLVIRSR